MQQPFRVDPNVKSPWSPEQSPFQRFQADVLDVVLLFWELCSSFYSCINANAVCLQVVGGLDIHKKMVVDVWAPLCLLTPPTFPPRQPLSPPSLKICSRRPAKSTLTEWKYSLSSLSLHKATFFLYKTTGLVKPTLKCYWTVIPLNNPVVAL